MNGTIELSLLIFKLFKLVTFSDSRFALAIKYQKTKKQRPLNFSDVAYKSLQTLVVGKD